MRKIVDFFKTFEVLDFEGSLYTVNENKVATLNQKKNALPTKMPTTFAAHVFSLGTDMQITS